MTKVLPISFFRSSLRVILSLIFLLNAGFSEKHFHASECPVEESSFQEEAPCHAHSCCELEDNAGYFGHLPPTVLRSGDIDSFPDVSAAGVAQPLAEEAVNRHYLYELYSNIQTTLYIKKTVVLLI